MFEVVGLLKCQGEDEDGLARGRAKTHLFILKHSSQEDLPHIPLASSSYSEVSPHQIITPQYESIREPRKSKM
jgi:hypothetical protein